eukprot:TRINITY_DN2540_c0_g1_i4.p1 TRINITY_DN2540_c0_g1~~TRINITY_DN2540_c0_g1_i4.p1  ORF type:complete len:518 (-),score=119.07 TRINITY_DN2540_c0_g1_i4:289-1842(-)
MEKKSSSAKQPVTFPPIAETPKFARTQKIQKVVKPKKLLKEQPTKLVATNLLGKPRDGKLVEYVRVEASPTGAVTKSVFMMSKDTGSSRGYDDYPFFKESSMSLTQEEERMTEKGGRRATSIFGLNDSDGDLFLNTDKCRRLITIINGDEKRIASSTEKTRREAKAERPNGYISEEEEEDFSSSDEELKSWDTKQKESDGGPKLKKKPKGYTQLRELTPINLEAEQKVFFSLDGHYNPFFLYNQPDIRIQFSKPHKSYLNLAVKILTECIREYGIHAVYSEEQGGRLITMEETSNYFRDYIRSLELEEHLTFEFAENTVAPTCVSHGTDSKSRVIIGLPLHYREKRIVGVMNHEIGTHFIRKFNDKNQPWFKNRRKLQMKAFICDEEGLAALNQLYDVALDETQKPYMFNAALHYYSAYMASVMSFQELYDDLKKYVANDEKRWKECVRVKRGIQDTTEPTGMYKDQVYLKGSVEILKSRKKIDFLSFHAGKMSVQDHLRLKKLGYSFSILVFETIE